MSLQSTATKWAGLQSNINHLVKLIEQGNLNAQQVDAIDDHINYIHEEVDQLESYLMDQDESFYYNMRNIADSMNITPSPEFMNHVNTYLSELTLDGQDFAIHKAVEQYNSFYYGCSILISPSGHIYFNGIDKGNQPDVLFRKGIGYHNITISDVHNKLNQLQSA